MPSWLYHESFIVVKNGYSRQGQDPLNAQKYEYEPKNHIIQVASCISEETKVLHGKNYIAEFRVNALREALYLRGTMNDGQPRSVFDQPNRDQRLNEQTFCKLHLLRIVTQSSALTSLDRKSCNS
jgi:hypothetical protein